ncbi:MAG TPA: YkvA family protein [bacterium]|nr:YkvA family protein [bacterium]
MTDKKQNAIKDVFENASEYAKHYDPSQFFDKIKEFGKKAGSKVVFAALLLFYAVKSENMPLKEKAIVAGALGYFIMPLDLIPDFIPIVGYGDDFAVLFATVRMISAYIDPQVINDAKFRLTEWFGEVNDADLEHVLKILS